MISGPFALPATHTLVVALMDAAGPLEVDVTVCRFTELWRVKFRGSNVIVKGTYDEVLRGVAEFTEVFLAMRS